MWTDFQNCFTNLFVRKFSVYVPQIFPAYLQYDLVRFENPKIRDIIWSLAITRSRSKNVTKFLG